MKCTRGWMSVVAVSGLVSAGILNAAMYFGPEWVEDGDAGSSVETAQRTTGVGALTAIRGRLEGLDSSRGAPDLEDLYIIQIDDVDAFFAGLSSACFIGRLFLFDMDGFGLLGAEGFDPDRGKGGTFLFGEGEDLPGPGEYILAITVRDRQPFSASGPIFNLPAFGQTGPNGDGANDPLEFWDGEPDEAECGDYDVNLNGVDFVPPANNDCFDAEPIGLVVDHPFSTIGATDAGGSPCVPLGSSIWYVFTAPCSGEVSIDLCGSEYDTMLAVYDGDSCDPLSPLLACNDDTGGVCSAGFSFQSAVTFQAVAGNSYLIEVGGWLGLTGIGDITIQMDCVDTCELAGRPDPDGTSDRVIRGFVLAWAVNSDNEQIRWNHLSGAATVVDYRSGAAWEYGAWAAPVMQDAAAHGQSVGTPGEINLDGVEYAAAYEQLLLNFEATGSLANSQNGIAMTAETDLTLHILSADLRQDSDGPITTLAQVDIWNMNETKFSNTRRCLTCWDEVLLSNFTAQPNNFLLANLQTTHGKARIHGIAAAECGPSSDAALLGVASRLLRLSTLRGDEEPRSDAMMAGTNLFGMGAQAAQIQYDVLGAPPESELPTLQQKPRRPGAPAGKSVSFQRGQPIDETRRGSVFEKGSLLAFSKVEIKFDVDGNLIQDTFIQLTNDFSEDVRVQMMFVNGDDPMLETSQFTTCLRPGWNWVDNEITLTGNQTLYWSAQTGQPAGVSPFAILDP